MLLWSMWICHLYYICKTVPSFYLWWIWWVTIPIISSCNTAFQRTLTSLYSYWQCIGDLAHLCSGVINFYIFANYMWVYNELNLHFFCHWGSYIVYIIVTINLLLKNDYSTNKKKSLYKKQKQNYKLFLMKRKYPLTFCAQFSLVTFPSYYRNSSHIFLIFNYVFVNMWEDICGGQKRALIPGWELQSVVSCAAWVLSTELGPSAWAVCPCLFTLLVPTIWCWCGGEESSPLCNLCLHFC